MKRKPCGGWALKNAKKTRCPKGHKYSGDNLYISPSNSRQCRKCKNDGQRKRRATSAALLQASKSKLKG